MATRRKKTYTTMTETVLPYEGGSVEETPNFEELTVYNSDLSESEVKEEEQVEDQLAVEEIQSFEVLTVLDSELLQNKAKETVLTEELVIVPAEETVTHPEVEVKQTVTSVKKPARVARPQPLPKRRPSRNIPKFI
jgi:hypothetical protein